MVCLGTLEKNVHHPRALIIVIRKAYCERANASSRRDEII
jgi:hypothetical protein